MQRILVVDDECLVADTLGLIFRQHGFEVKVTYSAAEALKCALAFLPDLLLCDITMPKRSELDLMADFSQHLPQCQVLVLTGYHSNLVRVREQTSKPIRVLTKPCNPVELLREAGRALKRLS